ncbi:carboxylesterase/lipase family protein [Paenibacillus sp. MCAF20]
MIVETRYGKIRGHLDNGMLSFKGVSYARAPVGSLRFQPPQAPEAWDGVKDATKYGNRAMQQTQEEGFSYSEDCLNLNIWTPAADGSKRPVIFFIHGGGHVEGSNSDAFYAGHRLIRSKDAVMVSPNYRLGAFGYLYLGDILGERYAQSGNCGLLDQLFALRWVRDNIASFGGDPDNIILMGQSAGGKSVANLMVTPLARGLYSRAIIQSGGVQCIRDRATAMELANRVLRPLGIEGRKDADAAEERLQRLKAEELLAAQVEAYAQFSSAHLFGPVIDGHVYHETPESYIGSGKLGSTPVLIGYAREELTPAEADPAFDEADVPDKLFYTYGNHGEGLLEKYKQFAHQAHPSIAFGKLQTQYVYGNASISLTQLLAESGCEVWCYRWDFEGRGLPNHSSEMPYLFGVSTAEREDGYDPEHAYMDEWMNEAWMAFVTKGNPNHPGLPYWPSCSSGEIGYRLLLDERPIVEPLHLHAYDKRFPMQVISLNESGSSRAGGIQN